MSATPYRPSDDSAFGAPQVDVSYRQAVKESAVKELQGHAYHYKIDAIDESGELVSFTTAELIEAAGGDSQEKIDKLTRKMRFSPKYISPLITNPIDRMLRDRLRTGMQLQAIIGCMSVSHANLVFEQDEGPHRNQAGNCFNLTKLFQHLHRVAICITDGDLQRHLPGQRMGCAPKARVICTERHLDHVEQTFGDIAVFNQTRRRLLGGHLDRCVVVGRANDEIRFGHNTPLIGPVVMRESRARCFDNTDSLRWGLGRFPVDVR